MVTLKELNPKNFKTTSEIDENLNKLLIAVNILREKWGNPMIITSGLRDIEDHKRIYREKGISEDKIPMASKHLFGQACDISDPDKKLQHWILNNLDVLEIANVYCEDFNHTLTWVHVQCAPYGSWKSGKSRFFLP